MDDPPLASIRKDAIESIRRALVQAPNQRLSQVQLANEVKWARSFANLGKFQDFLRSCEGTVHMDDSFGAGQPIISMTLPDNKFTSESSADEHTDFFQSDLRRNAIQAICRTLQAQDGQCMLQITLALAPDVRWSENFAKLGKFEKFLRSCEEFEIDDSRGFAKNMVNLNTGKPSTLISRPSIAMGLSTDVATKEELRTRAIDCIRRVLERQPSKSMLQASLACYPTVKWATNFAATLGKFQYFLLSCPNIFSTDNHTVCLRIATKVASGPDAAPQPAVVKMASGASSTHEGNGSPGSAETFKNMSRSNDSGATKSYADCLSGVAVTNLSDKSGDTICNNAPPPPPAHKEAVTPALPSFENDLSLWRDFDKHDKFYYEGSSRLRTLVNHRSGLWERRFDPALPSSPLKALLDDAVLAKQIYDSAYFRSTRLTIAVKNVVNHPAITKSLLENKFLSVMPEDNRSQLFVRTRNDTNFIFLSVSVTVCGPDPDAWEAYTALDTALRAGRITLQKFILGVIPIGYKPVEDAVDVTVKTLSAIHRKLMHAQNSRSIDQSSPTPVPNDCINGTTQRKNSFVSLSLSSGASNSASNGHGNGDGNPGNASPLTLPVTGKVWPDEYTLEDASKKIHDPSAVTELGEYIKQATADMAEKEAILRRRCAEMRLLPERERKRYGSSSHCEWIVDPTFFMGKGSEATIYMGLYQDPAHPNSDSVLVAIKQSHDETNPFNSREQEHLMSLKRQPGIAQYHTSFTLEYGAMAIFVLAQDIGLLSLRDLISGKGVRLTPEQKFKLTKALCMAVKDLHTECSVVHRDLRPENVLLMRDGRMCITDFGLSRSTKFQGTLKYTALKKTTMQPFEVQSQYGEAKGTGAGVNVPVAHSGDVFMLGCVLAYIHQGRDPFTDDKIRARAAPDVDERIKTDQPWLYHLLSSMMEHDPQQRPSCAYVLKHPYFAGHNVNFNACLFDNIEATLVRDNRPHDDDAFRALEELLRPIEQKMAALPSSEKWYNQLPVDLFRDDLKLPFKSYPLKFVKLGTAEPRAEYPLPELAQLLKWIRNAVIHLRTFPHMQEKLRLTRPSAVAGANNTAPAARFPGPACAPLHVASSASTAAGARTFYETAGEFFMSHPAVQWLLPAVWKLTLARVAQIERDKAALVRENERRYEEFMRQCRQLEDLKTFTESVLE